MKAPSTKPIPSDERDDPPLSKAQRKELQRRLDEMLDPTRFIIVSAFSKRFVLYYNAESGCYGMDKAYASLFKQQSAAEAVRKTLKRGKRRNHLQVVRVKKLSSGWRLLGKIHPLF